MMTTVFKLKNADFTGQNLPNINVFLNRDSLEFAYDFRQRDGMFDDLSGNYSDPLQIYKNDPKAGKANVLDPDGDVITPIDSDKGIRVRHGYLKSSIPIKTINLNSDEFTIMVKGGLAPETFPSTKVLVENPYEGNLIDFGSNTSNLGWAVKVGRNTSVGLSVNSWTMAPSIATTNSSNIIFITYKDGAWTITNKTTGATVSKTNSQMGLTDTVSGNKYPVVVFGGSPRSDMTASHMFTDLYQVAKWNKALTDQEIDAQFKMTNINNR